ncbi:armadillo-type protein [Chytridium lagenaria]|nr:armadillo-type protein [Chytridium lagenaria]
MRWNLFYDCCSWCKRPRTGSLYEPLLDTEREAVAELLHYLENRDNVNFFEGEPLQALSSLAYSDNVDLQRSAALAFVEITEKDVRQVNRDAIECGIYLLQSTDVEVQRAAAAAIGNLAVFPGNQVLIVDCGALEPLVHLMLSGNPEVQCNAVGCITNLATHGQQSTDSAVGALVPLTRLARSKDLRVQRNATGALLNMTHTIDNRQQLVTAGALPVLVSLLSSPDYDVQYYCTTSLSNIAVDTMNRTRLATSEPTIIPKKFQIDIVAHDGLAPLLSLLKSKVPQIVLAAAACIRNISIHPSNEDQCHAMSTIRNLASSDENKVAIVNAGAVEKIGGLLRMSVVPLSVKGEMTACLAVLALTDEVKPNHTSSTSVDVRANSAAAIGNLASKLDDAGASAFIKEWPDIRSYIYQFLTSDDVTFQHIAVWTLLQFTSGDERLRSKVAADNELLAVVQELSGAANAADGEGEGEGVPWALPNPFTGTRWIVLLEQTVSCNVAKKVFS